jgi:hypothetical protein
MILCPGGKVVRRFFHRWRWFPALRLSGGREPIRSRGAGRFTDAGCPPTQGTELDIEVKAPAVTHTIKLNRVRAWVNGVSKSPKDKVLKDRLKELLSVLP